MTQTPPNRLQRTLTQLQLKWGDRVIAPASEQKRAVAPTGFARLDEALAGGLPIPSFTFMRGLATSGATTVAFKTLAQRQQDDTFGAVVDLNGRFDPHLADLAGVDLNRLLLSRPSSPDSAVGVLRDLLKHGNTGVIVVASGTQKLRFSSEDQRRFMDALKRSNCVVVALNGMASALPDELMDTRLQFERQSWIVREGFHVGITTRVQIARRPLNQQRSVELDIIYGDLA